MTTDLSSLFDLSDFPGKGRIIAAVSGGSDSLAMLLLVHDYLARVGQQHRLVAITVDHGLRPASAHEARAVALLCAQRGISHQIYSWDGPKPHSAVSHQARLARYELLCQAAAHWHAAVIVTGHTLDDQAETYAMRVQRGRGRGLAAMPRLALLQHKYRLLRPLLNTRRQALRQYLVSRGVAWINDPSNENPRYERVRIRQSLDENAVQHARQAVAMAAAQRRAQAQAVAAVAAKLAMRLRGECLCFDFPAAGPDDGPALAALVAIAAAVMGGAQYPAAECGRLLTFIAQTHNTPRRMTLSGAVIEVTAKYLRIWREKRNIASCQLCPGQTAIWDGRYRISNHGDEAVLLRPPALRELQQITAPWRRHGLDARDLHFPSLETTCMICGTDGAELPVLAGRTGVNTAVRLERIMLPFDWLVSGHDWAIYRCLQPVLHLMAGKLLKNAHNCHDLEGLTLATARSEHMLQENLTGAVASSGQVELL